MEEEGREVEVNDGRAKIGLVTRRLREEDGKGKEGGGKMVGMGLESGQE